MLIHNEIFTILSTDTGWTGSGEIKVNSSHKLNGMLKQLYVKSATSTTTFKIQLLDRSDRVVFDTEDFESGLCNKTNLETPLKDSVYTLRIYSSSAEENFDAFLGIEE